MEIEMPYFWINPDRLSAMIIRKISEKYFMTEDEAICKFMASNTYRRIRDDEAYRRSPIEGILGDFVRELEEESFGPLMTRLDVAQMKIGVVSEFSKIYRMPESQVAQLFQKHRAFEYIENNPGLLATQTYGWVAGHVQKDCGIPVPDDADEHGSGDRTYRWPDSDTGRN